ncbi:MAG: radical SAM protein [Spirochaetaceae bacterium]|jgi:MoaA/NifB/PqqE/SkfB family radical SAM enzyme|nr:radical SAM protein [Spirochaetaceae bacterium]
MFSFNTKLAMAKAVFTKKSPFYIQFYVSKHCHLECKMCNIVEANSNLESFDTVKIEKIAENLVKIKAGVVLLTGGEPFLRQDIDKIVTIFKSKKLDVRMQTAGLVSKWNMIKNCAACGARDINVSLDTLNEELQDYINGVNGSWKNAIKTISFISKTFPPGDSVCALGCVLSQYNIDEIEAVLDFATRIGWWLSLVPVHITTKDKPLNFRGYDEYFSIQKENFQKLESLIKRLKKKKRAGYNLFDSDDYLDSIYHFVTTGSPSWRHNGVCDSPNLYFAILPDGSFAPCCDHRLKEKLYVYDDAFPEIYKSQEFTNSVKAIVKNCSGCNFGSFPEMSLSARSCSTITERLILQFKSKRKRPPAPEECELFNIISDIKAGYPGVYSAERVFNCRDKKIMPET